VKELVTSIWRCGDPPPLISAAPGCASSERVTPEGVDSGVLTLLARPVVGPGRGFGAARGYFGSLPSTAGANVAEAIGRIAPKLPAVSIKVGIER